VKESTGKIFGDKKLETEGSRRIERCGARKIRLAPSTERLPMELIMIIVVLVLLFGGGGGYLGRSRGYW
jgi:hypothetical protein